MRARLGPVCLRHASQDRRWTGRVKSPQWQGELHDKFRQDFEVVRGAVLRTTYGSNP